MGIYKEFSCLDLLVLELIYLGVQTINVMLRLLTYKTDVSRAPSSWHSMIVVAKPAWATSEISSGIPFRNPPGFGTPTSEVLFSLAPTPSARPGRASATKKHQLSSAASEQFECLPLATMHEG